MGGSLGLTAGHAICQFASSPIIAVLIAVEIIVIALVLIIGEVGPGSATFVKDSNFVRVVVGAGVILSIGTVVAWLAPGSIRC